jgi:GNAT superfamily N-acetyltransferase
MERDHQAIRIETGVGRERPIGKLLAEVFADDPNGVLVGLSRTRRYWLLRAIMTPVTRGAARRGYVFAAVTADSGRVVGAMLLVPSWHQAWSRLKFIRMTPVLARMALAAGTLFSDYMRSVSARNATLPSSGDWWLWHTIAVDPRVQGRGVGTRLFNHAVGIADATGLPSYFHTISPAVEKMCARLGFVVEGPPLEVYPGAEPYRMMHRPGRLRQELAS